MNKGDPALFWVGEFVAHRLCGLSQVLGTFHPIRAIVIETDDFRAMLHAAAADMDTMEFEGQELPVSAVVGSLDEVMRETGDSMQRRIRRLRTVQEAEDAVD